MNKQLVDTLKSTPASSELWDREIIREWYDYGLAIGDDFFMKFMMHWIGFNWFYRYYDNKNEEHPPEIDAIKRCVRKNIDVFKKYNAFNSNEISLFLIAYHEHNHLQKHSSGIHFRKKINRNLHSLYCP